jgi:hypothetical protein
MGLHFVVFGIGVAAAALASTFLGGLFYRCTGIGNWVDQYWGDGSIADDWALGARQVEPTTSAVATPAAAATRKPIVAVVHMTSDAAPLEYGAVINHLRFMSDYNLEIVPERDAQRATVRAPVGYLVDHQLLRASLLAVVGDPGVERVSGLAAR